MPGAVVPQIRVVFHHGTGLVARAIRLQTRSPWNHASLAIDGVLYEADPDRGVCAVRTIRQAAAQERVLVCAVLGLTASGIGTMTEWLTRQLGKPYDWTMVVRFVTRRQETRRTRGRWFCSELVFAALQQAGVDAFQRTAPWEVSPGMLARSPRLREVPA